MPYADPEKRREARRQADRKRRAAQAAEREASRAREDANPVPANPSGSNATVPIEATNPAGIAQVLQESIDDIRASRADPLMKGRVLASLAAQVLKAHEAGELVERFDALEKKLQEVDR